MKNHPPYHLRPNKAVDRLTFFEAVRRLEKIAPLDEYTYYGMGGPYLEEFRLLYEFCPQLKMVSIEKDKDTYSRQQRHKPCGTLKLIHQAMGDFVSEFESRDSKSIIWLDHHDLKFNHFGDYIALLSKLPEYSVVKISLRCSPDDYREPEKEKEFVDTYRALIPALPETLPRKSVEFATLLQKMVQVASQQALPAALGMRLQPISSFYYADGVAGMFTLTGIVAGKGNNSLFVREKFSSWEFASLKWAKPKEINLPQLSTKERLLLQEHLPCDRPKVLGKTLGYRLAGTNATSSKMLEQYARFHRYFPFFMKGIP